MFVTAFCLLKFPLQHYMSLARFEHYGICMFVWAMGFFMQSIWSWRHLSVKGRCCQIATGIYVGTFAIIFYQSPWLDARMSVQTQEQDLLRLAYAGLSAVFGCVVSLIWLAWILERHDEKAETSN